MSGRNLQRFYGHPRNDNFSLSHSFKCTNTMADGPTQPPSWKMFQGHMPRYLHQYRTTQNVRQFKDSKFHSKYINIQKKSFKLMFIKKTPGLQFYTFPPHFWAPHPLRCSFRAAKVSSPGGTRLKSTRSKLARCNSTEWR